MNDQETENPDPHSLIRDVYFLLTSEAVAQEIDEIEDKIICFVRLSKDGFWLEDLEPLSRVFVILSFFCENKANDIESLIYDNLDDYFRRILLILLSVAHRPIRMHFPSDWINGPFTFAKYLTSLASILTNEALLNDERIENQITKSDSSLLNYKNVTDDFKNVKYEVKEVIKRLNCKVKKDKRSYFKMEHHQQNIIENTKEWLEENELDQIEKGENLLEEKVLNVHTYDEINSDDIGSIYTEIPRKIKRRKKKKDPRKRKTNNTLFPNDISDGSCTCNIESDNLEWDTLDEEKFEAEVEEEGLDYSFDSYSFSSGESTITESMTSTTPSRHWSSTISYSEMDKEEIIPIKSEEIQLLILNSLHSLLINKKIISNHGCCSIHKNCSDDYCYVTEEQARTAMDFGSCAARISDALALLKNKVFIFCAKLATLLCQKSCSFAMTLVKRGNINTVLLRQYLFYKRGIPLEELPDDSFLIFEKMLPPSEDRILESQESGRLLWQLLATVKNWQKNTENKQTQPMDASTKYQESDREDNRSLINSWGTSNIFEPEENVETQKPVVGESIEENIEESFRILNCENYRIQEKNPHYTRSTETPKIMKDKNNHLCVEEPLYMNYQDYYNYNYNLSENNLKSSEKEMEENDELEHTRLEKLSFTPPISATSSTYHSSISTPNKAQYKFCSYCRCPLNTPMREALEASKSSSVETSLEAYDFESQWNHWLVHHDILGECPGPTSAALEALILHCKWMILIGNKIERNNLLAQIVMILKLWKELPISRGHVDCLLTSLCVCEEAAELAANGFKENSLKTLETPKWSYQSPGSPISMRAEDLRAQQLALIGSTILIQNHNSTYFHLKFQVLENVCKKMKPCKESEDKLFCEHCGKLPTKYEWDYILVMVVCTTIMAKNMAECYMSGEGIKYLVALIGYLKNVLDMERPKTVLIHALHALHILLEHFEDNSFLRETAIEANAIDILLHILKSLISANMKRLNSFWEENITIYCLSSLTILIRRNEAVLSEYAQEFLQVSLDILKICPPQISNELLICFLDLCWEGVVCNPAALKEFVEQSGAYLLLDILDHVIYPIITQILGIIGDMAYEGECIPHLVTWRSKKTGLSLYPCLLNIWRISEEMMNVERDQYGIIANLKRPLVPSLITSKHAVPFIGSARSRIYALLQILENNHKDKVDICDETYRIGLSPPLPLTDEITLVLARNYLALTTAEHSSMNLRNQEKSLLFKDNFLIQLIAKHFEDDIEDVRREQMEILDKLKAEEKNEEKVLYKKFQKALVPAINENNRIVDKMARTSNRSKMLEAKESQRTEINKELCFPPKAGPEHCHRTYQEHFSPTVFSGKHFLLKSIKDVLHEEPPRPVSPISNEEIEDIFPEEIYNPLVKEGFKEYR